MNAYEVIVSQSYPGQEFGVIELEAKSATHAENLAVYVVRALFGRSTAAHCHFYAVRIF